MNVSQPLFFDHMSLPMGLGILNHSAFSKKTLVTDSEPFQDQLDCQQHGAGSFLSLLWLTLVSYQAAVLRNAGAVSSLKNWCDSLYDGLLSNAQGAGARV